MLIRAVDLQMGLRVLKLSISFSYLGFYILFCVFCDGHNASKIGEGVHLSQVAAVQDDWVLLFDEYPHNISLEITIDKIYCQIDRNFK